jgi:putative ABC transport system permease protein
MVYINYKSLENIQVQKYDRVKIKCVSNSEMNNIRDKIMEKGFIVSSLSDTVDQANQVFSIIQIILMCFGIVALVVSAIGMFNTMTIALLERTNEIGIMKSIGASNLSISAMFIMESAVMGFLGGLGGVLIGLLGGRFFNFLINTLAKRLGGESVSLFYSPLWFVILIILFAGVVGLFTGIVPARRASKIDPLDALQYK